MLTNSKKMRGPRGLQGQRLHWAFLGPQPERRELELTTSLTCVSRLPLEASYLPPLPLAATSTLAFSV
jgi:hypothetical protein